MTQQNRPMKNDYFLVRTANEVMEDARKMPPVKEMFGPLFYENEICILFADTNVGKSILAVQIGNAVAKGHLDHLPLAIKAEPKKVLYLDCELSGNQFLYRYTSEGRSPADFFSENFTRAEINPDFDPSGFKSTLDLMMKALDDTLVSFRGGLVIIDNITYLNDETENAKSAMPIMKSLKALKDKHNVTFLVLAHTPKRDPSMPLDRNDLQGSKMLINFCDSSFTIGESSSDPSLRYLKQIKARNTEIVYNADNVMLCTIRKENGYLAFHFEGYGAERDHLWTEAYGNRQSRRQKTIELRRQGMSLRQIGEELGISRMTAQRYVKGVEPTHEGQELALES